MKLNNYIIYIGLILTFVLVIFMGDLSISSSLVSMLTWFSVPYLILYVANRYIHNKILIKSILTITIINLILSLLLTEPAFSQSQNDYTGLMTVPILQIIVTFVGMIIGAVLSKVLKK